MAPNFNFWTKQGPTILVSNKRYWFLRVFRNYTDQNFFLPYIQFLNNLWRLFIFSNYIEVEHFKLDLLKRYDAGASENFLIVNHPKEDHNEHQFKRSIIDGILDQLGKSSKTKEASCKWSTIQYNSINTRHSQNILWSDSSIQRWSTSKSWKTGCVIKTRPTEKFL